jgi:hypothetical protein
MTPEEHLETLTDLFREVSETFRVEPMTAEQLRASDRKYFAAMAMQGLLSSWTVEDRFDATRVSTFAVCCADALLAALEDGRP